MNLDNLVRIYFGVLYKLLFDSILHVPVNNFFSHVGTDLPGLKRTKQ